MEKIVSLLIIAMWIGFGAACKSQPETENPVESPVEDDRGTDDQETIAEDDENVNDVNGLEEGKSDDQCPPPREHQDLCAQVIAYGLTADGACCEYSTPCDVPEELESFSSQQECQEAARE